MQFTCTISLTPFWCEFYSIAPVQEVLPLSLYSHLILPWSQLAHTHLHPQPWTLVMSDVSDVRKLAPHGGFSTCSWTLWPRTTFPSGVQGLWLLPQYPRPIPGPSPSSLPVVYFSSPLKEQCKDKQDPGHLHFEHSPNPVPLLISNFPWPWNTKH